MNSAKIIILAGQSNAVGVGHIKFLNKHFTPEKIAEYEKGYSNVLINYYSHGLESKNFVKTTMRIAERNKETFGPEVGMAEKLTELFPNDTFYIVKWAFGGSRLFDDWYCPSDGEPYDKYATSYDNGDILTACNVDGNRPNAGWCYNGLISKVKQSIKILEDNNLKPEIRAFCWMQGESDSHDKNCVEKYQTRYRNLMNDFNSEFSDYLSHCKYADAGISPEWEEYRAMNQFKKEYAEEDKNRIYIDTIKNGLTTLNEPFKNPDTAHYDSGSLIKLGQLFIDAVKENLKR